MPCPTVEALKEIEFELFRWLQDDENVKASHRQEYKDRNDEWEDTLNNLRRLYTGYLKEPDWTLLRPKHELKA